MLLRSLCKCTRVKCKQAALLLLFIPGLLTTPVLAQSVNSTSLLTSGDVKSTNQSQWLVPLKNAFDTVEKSHGVKFVYDDQLVDEKFVHNYEINDDSLAQKLGGMLARFDLTYVQKGPNTYVISPQETPVKEQKQTGTISGEVRDIETGEPLAGASIFLDGTTNGTTVGADGEFTLKDVEAGTYTLVVTFVGYEKSKQEIIVRENETATVNFELEFLSSEFDELVVIGYGSANKSDLTGSVSTVRANDIGDLSPTINIDQALQGKASGVHVIHESGQPGSASRVRIRGTTSLLGSNQPLYVIDGIPVLEKSNIPDDGTTFNRDLLQEGLNSPLGNINPEDIESISILKDASAAAIYGSRAANGVIIINTKKGSSEGRQQFNARYSVSTQEARTTNVLNANQFREIWTEAVENSGSTNAFAQSVLDGSYFGDANTNWEEEISRKNPVTSNFDFSASGGNEQIQYYTSVGLQDQAGTFDNSMFKRYSGTLNLDSKLSERFNMGTKLNFSSSTQESPDNGLMARIYNFRPDISVYDEDGDYAVSEHYNLENPVALSQAYTSNETTQVLASVYGMLELYSDLVLKSTMSVTYNSGNLKSLYPSSTITGGFSRLGGPGDGYGQESNSTNTNYVWDNTLQYQKTLANIHDLTAMIGSSLESQSSNYLQASGKGFPRDEVLTNLSSASREFTIRSNEIQSGLISNFGRFNYDYDNRYLVSLSARVDGSSKFAEENKWGFFPTVSAAWRISNESFFSGVDFVDELKLRASAGRTGQQDFSPYQWRTLFQAGTYGGGSAVVQSQLGNSRLKWEVTDQFDAGLDFMLFNGRLSGSLGYYEKNTNDLLYFFKTPGNTGFDQVISNLGDTENKGIEFELEGDVIQSNDFNWNLSFNISRNRNKLVRLNDDFLDKDAGVITPPNTGSRLRVGDPLGLIYGYVAEGIFQDQAEIDALNEEAGGFYQAAGTAPGDLKFRDLDGDGQITTADQTIIGNTQPDFTGGITSTWRYKGLSVSTLFTFSVGNDLRWGTQSTGINFANTFAGENKMADVMNRWTPQNPTDQPRAVYLDPNQNNRISSYYVHDASFLRLKNLNISYELPELLRTGLFRSASVYVTATNLLTFTKYPGADPETNNLYNDDVSSGLDNSRYPTPKVYTAGIRVGF